MNRGPRYIVREEDSWQEVQRLMNARQGNRCLAPSVFSLHLPVKSIKKGDAAALPVPVMALSDPNLEKEELEMGQSDGYGTSPLEHLESPEAERDAVPGPSVTGGSGHPDRELPAFMKAEDDRLQTGSGDEKQQISSVKEQLLLYC